MFNRPDSSYNRDEVKTLFILQRNPHSSFFQLPDEMIALTKYFLDLLEALKEAAYGKLDELKIRLEGAKQNKELLRVLLLQKDAVTTPSGIYVKCTTLLGCAICSLDPEMVAMIKPYFLELKNGEAELERQLEYYLPCIEEIQTQKPEDLTWLFNIIIDSPPHWIAAELATGDKYDPNFYSCLRNALNLFREEKLAPKQRIIDKPRMYCNYQNLINAYKIFEKEWRNLETVIDGEDCYDKHYLVSQQILSFIKLTEATAYYRYLFAQGKMGAAIKNQAIKRSFSCLYDNTSFPDFNEQLVKSRNGVGFQSHISIWGRCTSFNLDALNVRVAEQLQDLLQIKTSALLDLCKPREQKKIYISP